MKKVIVILIIFSLMFISFFIFKKDEEKINKNISVILETEEGNIETNTFPSKNDYEYLSTECKNTEDNINTTFNDETWKLNLNVEEERIDGKFNCTVHFKENIKPNEPVLDESMVPVYYSEEESVWKVADKENKSTEHKWYDYEEKMWANSVTVKSEKREEYKNGSLGKKIKMEDILTMQVWIPRYKYKVWNYNLDGTKTSEPQEIEIKFEKGTKTTGEIKCTDNIQGESGDGTSEVCTINNEECSDSLCNNKYYTHPAFTFGSEKLTGFWVGKFEVSSDIDCIPNLNSTVGNGCNLTTINPLVKPQITSWRGAQVSVYENNIMKMNDNGNIYGFSSNVDTHMIKNIEWGAVAYLSHSKYGTCKDGTCEEISMNSTTNFITGCGMQGENIYTAGEICNSYNTQLGMNSSTTKNIYGAYDMNGGSYEYVMGDLNSIINGEKLVGYAPAYGSGYTGVVYNAGTYIDFSGTYNYPENKYIDIYTFNENVSNLKLSKLGDAIKEFRNKEDRSWYNDYNNIINSNNMWFLRGGRNANGGGNGIFASNVTHGGGHQNNSTRLIIVL